MRIIFLITLMGQLLFGTLISKEVYQQTDIYFEEGMGQVTFDMIPEYYEMNGKEYYISYDEQIRIAQLMNVIAVGETGLGKRFNTNGWNLRTGSYKDRGLTSQTIGEVINGRRRNTAAGMFQMMRRTLLDETKFQNVDKGELFDERMQVKLMVGRMIRMRGLLKFLRGNKSKYSFGRTMSYEFASVEDPKKGRGMSYHGGKAHTRYASIIGILDMPLYT